jgi:hypothetical protein
MFDTRETEDRHINCAGALAEFGNPYRIASAFGDEDDVAHI